MNKPIITDADRAHALGSNELKPCPFCNHWAFTHGFRNEDTDNVVYHVQCTNLSCTARTHCCATTEELARTEAVWRWNRRGGAT